MRRSVSSLKIGFLSFPRLVTWYRAPGNWIRSGLAMSFFINHIGKTVKDKDLTPSHSKMHRVSDVSSVKETLLNQSSNQKMIPCRRCCANGSQSMPPPGYRQPIIPRRKSTMNNTDIRSQYGLKYNPFLPDVPVEALFTIPGTEQFIMRVQAMAAEG